MTDKYHDSVLQIISEKGPTGVNALARELNVPLSTMQQYLTRQSYFRKTEDKKWDLPEKVMGDIKNTSLTLVTDIIENSILLFKAQIAELDHSVDNILNPLNTLKRGMNGINGTVASKPSKMHPDIKRVLDFAEKLQMAIKQSMSKIPEDYQDLYTNLDIVSMVVHKGIDYMQDSKTADLTGVLLGETDELSEDSIKLLEGFQK